MRETISIALLFLVFTAEMFPKCAAQFLSSGDDEEIMGYDNHFMERGMKGGKNKFKSTETIVPDYEDDDDEEEDCKKMKKKEKLIAFQKVVKVPRVTIVEKKKKKRKKKVHYY